jgi:SAM-dependent methyltransferase
MTEKEALDTIRNTCERIVNVGAHGGELQSFFVGKDYKTLNINPLSKADITASAYELPFPDESLDAIINFNLLEHLETPQRFVDEAKRVLKPGGYVYSTVLFVHPYHGGMNAGAFCPDYFRFTKDGANYLFRDFENQISSDGGFFFACKSFFPKFFHPFLSVAEMIYKGESVHLYYLLSKKHEKEL